MKWTIPSAPKEGDIRKRRVFAWLPVYAKFEDQMYKVWLETYEITECYVMEATICGPSFTWMELYKKPLFGEYESI